MRKARLAWDLFRAEGLRGFAERLADRREASRGRRGERTVAPADAVPAGAVVPVLDVLATPLAPRWGGVPVQLGVRLAEEALRGPTALLAPEAGWWTLRTTHGEDRRRARLGPWRPGADPSEAPDGAIGTVLEAARLVGAKIVNFEGASGWPPEALRAVARPGLKLVVSLHDFALFCPRPNLVEEPWARFCAYSRDAERCRACLGGTWSLPTGFVEDWRRQAGALLGSADAVVYPSEFLRRRHAELFPGVRPGLERVIGPPTPGRPAEGTAERVLGEGAGGLHHVAFVGAYRRHKGALVFEELLRSAPKEGSRTVRWSIFGSGDPALLLRARRLGARVVGHYRAGGLPRLLRNERVDVALLLSIWPETFGLTLGECRAAGVPVIAFEHGAIADRIAAEGGGLLVPPELGTAGVGALLERVLAGEVEMPAFRGRTAGPSATEAAAERRDLYRTLFGEAS
ncbi:MAG: glycosyltransferase [Holophagales bacterium]|nr:glycosyltransferase [Holophagales bacterium]